MIITAMTDTISTLPKMRCLWTCSVIVLKNPPQQVQRYHSANAGPSDEASGRCAERNQWAASARCYSVWPESGQRSTSTQGMSAAAASSVSTCTVVRCVHLYCGALCPLLLWCAVSTCTVVRCVHLYCGALCPLLLWCTVSTFTVVRCVHFYCGALCPPLLWCTVSTFIVVHCVHLYCGALSPPLLCPISLWCTVSTFTVVHCVHFYGGALCPLLRWCTMKVEVFTVVWNISIFTTVQGVFTFTAFSFTAVWGISLLGLLHCDCGVYHFIRLIAL